MQNLRMLYLLLAILATVMLFPGLWFDIIAISLDAKINAGNLMRFDSKIVDQSRSILGTIVDLFKHGLWLPAILIGIFSIFFPLTKLGLGLALFGNLKLPWSRLRLAQLLKTVGKWSMADVFVVAIFIAYLSSNLSDTHKQAVNLMGMAFNVEVVTFFKAELCSGFYFFTASCLLSHVSSWPLAKLIDKSLTADQEKS